MKKKLRMMSTFYVNFQCFDIKYDAESNTLVFLYFDILNEMAKTIFNQYQKHHQATSFISYEDYNVVE